MPAFTNTNPNQGVDPSLPKPIRWYNNDGYERNQPIVTTNTGTTGQMAFTTAFGERHRVTSATVHFASAVTATIQITLVSALNASFNTVLLTQGLTANSNVFWQPTFDLIQSTNDELSITTTGLAASGMGWYARVVGEAW